MEETDRNGSVPCPWQARSGFCDLALSTKCSQVGACPNQPLLDGLWSSRCEELELREREAQVRCQEAEAKQKEFGIVFMRISAAWGIAIPVFAMAYITLADPVLRMEKGLVTVSGGIAALVCAVLAWTRTRRSKPESS
jgi:hypothetical protein